MTRTHAPVSPGKKNVRVLYAAQTGVAPPTFVFFTNVATTFHFSYERYLANRLRESFGFDGTPIRLEVRARRREEKRGELDARLRARQLLLRRFVARRGGRDLGVGLAGAGRVLELLLEQLGGREPRVVARLGEPRAEVGERRGGEVVEAAVAVLLAETPQRELGDRRGAAAAGDARAA